MKSLSAGLFILCVAALSHAAPPEVLSVRGNKHIDNFAEAKRVVAKVFEGNEKTLYCDCRYYGKELNPNSCGIGQANAPKRLKKIEWEHIVPASKFGETIVAWREGASVCDSSSAKSKRRRGRKCAEKASPLFRQMEGDLHNLWPESGEINGRRSDKPPVASLAGGKVTSFGTCKTRIGKNDFEPRQEARGPIARAYLYMNWAYDVALAEEQKKMFEQWHQADPADSFECQRNQRIAKIQGNTNPFVDRQCASMEKPR